MKILKILWAVAMFMLLLSIVFPADARMRSVITAFIKANPCPSTGLNKAPCPGWVVDHGIPLCAGGADAPHNLFWQEKKTSYKKDVEERALCRRLKKLEAAK